MIKVDIRELILTLQFWTQGQLVDKERSDAMRIPYVNNIVQKWLGFGEFVKNYGSNLWAMLDNTTKKITPISPDVTSPSKKGKKRRSSGKGKTRTPTKDTAENNMATSYDNFTQDQFRFLEHAHAMDLDFVFHYYCLTPDFAEELFVPIAKKTAEPAASNENKDSQVSQEETAKQNEVSNAVDPDATQDSQESSSQQSTQDSQQSSQEPATNSQKKSRRKSRSRQSPQQAIEQQQLQQQQNEDLSQKIEFHPSCQVRYVEKSSSEFRNAVLGLEILDVIARSADTLSIRDLVINRDLRVDLMVLSCLFKYFNPSSYMFVIGIYRRKGVRICQR